MEIRPLPTTKSGFKNWADRQNPEEWTSLEFFLVVWLRALFFGV
jgi:hypothetical protein